MKQKQKLIPDLFIINQSSSNHNKMEEAFDVSLDVPWRATSDGKMEEELNTIKSIHSKNMKQFNELKDSIKASPILDIVSPVSPDHFKQIKRQYLEEEANGVSIVEKYNSEYNLLLEQESQLLCEIAEMEKKSKRIKLETEETVEKCDALKKTYREQKSALNIAKKLYGTSFGIEVQAESDNCDDEFTATVTFLKENVPVQFKISRTSKMILDFNASSFLSQEESEDLKSKFKESCNPRMLICALKDLVTNKVN